MTDRPDIVDCPDAVTFRQWYYLKAELVAFARTQQIKTTGGKFEIADRIAYFLDHGEPPVALRTTKQVQSHFDWHSAPLTDQTIITDSYKNTQNMRRYMQSAIPGYKFSIPFMAWMKANVGLTLADAVAEAKRIDADKKAGKKQPDQPHNQYNAYTRAYFDHIPDGTQNEVRQLWGLRRKRPGPYVFDPKDMGLLKEK